MYRIHRDKRRQIRGKLQFAASLTNLMLNSMHEMKNSEAVKLHSKRKIASRFQRIAGRNHEDAACSEHHFHSSKRDSRQNQNNMISLGQQIAFSRDLNFRLNFSNRAKIFLFSKFQFGLALFSRARRYEQNYILKHVIFKRDTVSKICSIEMKKKNPASIVNMYVYTSLPFFH